MTKLNKVEATRAEFKRTQTTRANRGAAKQRLAEQAYASGDFVNAGKLFRLAATQFDAAGKEQDAKDQRRAAQLCRDQLSREV